MSDSNRATVEALERLSTLEPAPARSELRRLVLGLLNQFLGRDPSDSIGPRDRFTESGFDSLRALDFKTLLERQFLCELHPTLLFDYATPEALVEYLADRVLGLAPPRAQSAAPTDDFLAAELARVSALSTEEMRLLLARNSQRLRRFEREHHEPIAIVGMGCRFPGGVDTPDALWRVLEEGRSLIGDVPETRWPMSRLYHPHRDAPGRINTRRAAMLDDVADFDARFFNISPREANELDPQQRLLLEVCWTALEHANMPVAELYGRPVGVFAGLKASEYFDSLKTGLPEESTAYRATGNALSTAAGRVSYSFGFTGPCFPIDTACSSSLVAIHLAVRSLRRGECSLALAGGANVLLDPHISVGLSKAHMLSSEGQCRTFDRDADGYVRAEGCAMVVLKPLSRALADGDHVYAVIRGTAINQDGASGGLTVPSGPAQHHVIRAALEDAQAQPYQVGYIEAHGTGTELGDPIEIGAIDATFGGAQRFHGQPLWVGSGKTNYGHMECAAGVAGVLKVALALKHELIPRNLNFENPNPRVAWDRTVVQVPVTSEDWPRGSVPRIAGVSSFGFSGTNAHAILEEAPVQRSPRRAPSQRFELVPLSARSEADLQRLAVSYAKQFRSGSWYVGDIAYTAGVGRSHLSHRAAFLADSVGSLIEKLEAFGEGKTSAAAAYGVAPSTEPDVAFLFTGQAAQYPGMGKELYASEASFRQTLDACARALDGLLDVPLTDILWGDASAQLYETGYAQPAIVAYELALASLWESWGITPRWLIGHSIGELAAASSAGVLTPEQAVSIAQTRGALMQRLDERGSMLAIQASADTVRPLIEARTDVSIAAYNGPEAVVISGRTEAVEAIGQAVRDQGAKVTALSASHAFHSVLMEPMLQEFRAATRGASGGALKREWISTLAPEAPPARDDEYWVRHVREPVRFAEAMQRLWGLGCRVHLEIGPGSTLVGMGRGVSDAAEARWIPSQHSEVHGRTRALTALAQLYVAGAQPRWRAVSSGENQKVVLPNYPFSRRRYWLQQADAPVVRGEDGHPLLGGELPLPPLQGGERVYSSQLSERSPAYLTDHRVGGSAVFPAAGYLELALASASTRSTSVRDLKISAALVLEERGRQVATVVGSHGAEIKSRVRDGAWVSHATWQYGEAVERLLEHDRLQMQERCTHELLVQDVYDAYAQRGLPYGEAFRGIRKLMLGEREVIAQIIVPAQLHDSRYAVHPALLDACYQAAGALVLDRDGMLLPVGIEGAVLHRALEDEAWCCATLAREQTDRVVLDVTCFDGEGRLALEVQGLTLVPTTAFRSEDSALERNLVHSTQWVSASEAEPQTDAVGRRWLVFADRNGLGEQLVWLLDEKGMQVTAVSRQQLSVEDSLAVDEVFGEVADGLTDLVYLWALDPGASDDPGHAAVHEHQLRSLIRIVQAYARAGAPSLRLHLVTRGAQQVGRSRDPLALTQAPLWGFAAALAHELPNLHCRCIDLPPSHDSELASLLLRELLTADAERRVALRDGQRFVARLVPSLDQTAGLALPDGPGYELRTTAYGTLQNLKLRALEPRAPAAGEVQIQVAAAALNFKDVLHAMGVLKEFAEKRGVREAPDQPLGLECAGRVLAVGPGVDHIRVGDEVIALADGTLASHIVVRAKHVARKPERWQLTEAAGLQTVFFTAAYSLLFLAKLKKGDRVLIQSAAGGVGQAALQICQWCGAEVFATASPGKWGQLRELGVKHVMNSRTFEYADEILRLTEGRGVDVVLNSLNEEHIPKSLSALARGGRFVDIGKVGIWSEAQMSAERPDIEYHTFDLGEALEAKIRYRDLLARLSDAFATGALRPVQTRVFPLTDAVRAFQLLASGKTIGKLVLTMPPPLDRSTSTPVRADRSYIISGGLGALGIVTARWLSERGAGALVLLGRREPQPAVAQAVAALREAGTRVEVVQVDVADRDALETELSAITAQLPPVAGVVHAAGVLSDGLVERLEWPRVWDAMSPKVAGGWNLHRWSTRHELDWFLCYASIASVIGSAGQSAYAAANAFLESLMHERRRLGLPGTAIHWGSWAGSGMAAAQPRVMRERMRRLGLRELSAPAALEAMDRVVSAGAAQAVVAAVSWAKYLRSVGAEAGTFLSPLDAAQHAHGVQRSGVRSAVLAVASPGERLELLTTFTRAQVATVVGLDAVHEIGPDTKFTELGIDSLLGVDLRNLLGQELGVTLSTIALSDHPTLRALVSYLDSLLPATNPAEGA